MPANNRKTPSKPEKVKDAYWTIYRLGTEVEVFDEIHNRPLRRFGRICPTVEQAEDYISQVLEKYRGKIVLIESDCRAKRMNLRGLRRKWLRIQRNKTADMAMRKEN